MEARRPWERVLLNCTARLVHGGRTTQVWDAEVKNERSGKTIALFRCTQILLYGDRNACGVIGL